MGIKPEVHGVLNINKPAVARTTLWMWSAGFWARDGWGITGTLDPQATGVLPLCVGRATRIAQYLTQADKEYVMTLRLGIATDTLDATSKETGRVEDIRVRRQDVEAVLPRFIGEIEQVPPLFSAKKYHGERLYRLARQWGAGGAPSGSHPDPRAGDVRSRHPSSGCVRSAPKARLRAASATTSGGRWAAGGGLRAHPDAVRTVWNGRRDHSRATGRARSGGTPSRGSHPGGGCPWPTSRPSVWRPEAGRLILHGGDVAASVIVQFPPEVSRGTLVRVLGYRKQLLSLAETLVGSPIPWLRAYAQRILTPVRSRERDEDWAAMRVIRVGNLEDLRWDVPAPILSGMGSMDRVHLGHQEILRQVRVRRGRAWDARRGHLRPTSSRGRATPPGAALDHASAGEAGTA